MTNKQALDLPPCTSFCQNSDNSNGICRACLEREDTTLGILQNIAKRMTSDSCVNYPQWLFTLVEAGIKTALTERSEETKSQPNQAQPVNKMMLDALEEIVRADNHFLLDSHYKKAKKAIAAASSAPVVEVDKELEEAVTKVQLATAKGLVHPVETTNEGRIFYKTSRIQLARQKGGAI